MNSITAYPLAWPGGWPRTESLRREGARFKNTLAGALSNLKQQIGLLGGKNVILSSNYTLGVEHPKDPGVCAYFEFEKQQLAIPCDRWRKIEHNVQAIALTVEAMRGMERWGAKHMISAMFHGFKALPEKSGGLAWWEILGVKPDATEEAIKTAYRDKAKLCHPDSGGSTTAMVQLNEAYTMACAQRAG